mmetsp:Transcript_35568/g.72472  ORF Transcript_35568/g.72472 Transcript_35568/m.72472 type:complete len:215 (-) Transcript_35568:694-1338(-)
MAFTPLCDDAKPPKQLTAEENTTSLTVSSSMSSAVASVTTTASTSTCAKSAKRPHRVRAEADAASPAAPSWNAFSELPSTPPSTPFAAAVSRSVFFTDGTSCSSGCAMAMALFTASWSTACSMRTRFPSSCRDVATHAKSVASASALCASNAPSLPPLWNTAADEVALMSAASDSASTLANMDIAAVAALTGRAAPPFAAVAAAAAVAASGPVL